MERYNMSIVINKTPNNLRIMKKIMRCDDGTNMKKGEGIEILAENIRKENFIRKVSSETGGQNII